MDLEKKKKTYIIDMQRHHRIVHNLAKFCKVLE